MKTNFADARKKAEQDGLLGSGDYLKIKEGANKFRLMSECLPHPGTYKGQKTFKWLCYVIDRTDAKLKPLFMPHTIYKQIEALQFTDDYAFEDVPMPYDLTINAKGAGTKDVEYTVVPARKNVEVTDPELVALDQAKPLKELQQALKDKAKESAPKSTVSDDHSFVPPPADDDEPPF